MEDGLDLIGGLLFLLGIVAILFLLPISCMHSMDRQDREETKLIDQIHDCWHDGKVAVISRDNVSCKEP